MGGRPATEVFRIANDAEGSDLPNPLLASLSAGPQVSTDDLHLIGPDGRKVAIDYAAAPMRVEEGQVVGAAMVFQDVTAARERARQLSYEATHDSLTGLVNRAEFERRIERVLDTARDKDDDGHVLLSLDLDQFKAVNDACGHLAGDELLCQVSQVISEPARKRDTVARIGGDNFAILLESCPLGQGVRIANDLCKRLGDFLFVWQDKPFPVDASIGVVAIAADSGSLRDVLSAADAASLIAKEGGGNRVHVYQPDEGERVTHRDEAGWVAQLNNALQDNRLLLTRQTILPLRDGYDEGEHFEVLVRMRSGLDGTVPAAAFLPAAERYNLMPVIDRWVIRALVDWFELNPASLARTHTCSVNLAGPSLIDQPFVEYVKAQLGRVKPLAEKICFEITETTAIANLVRARGFMAELRDMGCRFALDDFGKGMSSLAYLKNLPVDTLKIDGQFVKGIVQDSIDRALVEYIIRIAQELGLKTVAECVENAEIATLVRALGVDYAQGYSIDRPTPLQS
jgi:diguanylate cyclase (GGDEF)-like protein